MSGWVNRKIVLRRKFGKAQDVGDLRGNISNKKITKTKKKVWHFIISV